MQKVSVKERIDLVIKEESLIPNNWSYISPYRLAKLEATLREKPELPPQKIYGYIRQGYIKASLNNLGKKQVAKEEVYRYLIKQVK